MAEFEELAKQLAKQEGIDVGKKRKSKLDSKKRRLVAISPETFIFVAAFAKNNQLYLQEAADELIKQGIKVVFFKNSRPDLTVTRLMKFIRRKGSSSKNSR